MSVVTNINVGGTQSSAGELGIGTPMFSFIGGGRQVEINVDQVETNVDVGPNPNDDSNLFNNIETP